MLFRRKDNVRKIISCPRCGYQVLDGTEECPDCGLVFSRLEIATNREAKAKKLRHDRAYIVNTKKLPSDVSFKKLLIFSIFFGAIGGHCFYVGRYLRGSILLLNAILMVLATVFNKYLMSIDNGAFLATISTIFGIIELLWFWDIFAIITKRFKVPVAIDIEGEMLKQKQEYMESLDKLNIEENEDVKSNEIMQKNEKTEITFSDEEIENAEVKITEKEKQNKKQKKIKKRSKIDGEEQ